MQTRRGLGQSLSAANMDTAPSDDTFGLTQVTKLPKIQAQKPPLTQRQAPRSIVSSVQKTRGSMTQRRPHSTQDLFAKRYKGDMPSARSNAHSRLEQAAKEVENEFSEDVPKLTSRMKSLEQAPHVKQLIQKIENRILGQKCTYNKLHNTVRMLEDKLALTKYQEQYSRHQKIDNSGKERMQHTKQKQLKKVQKKIDDELHYEQTLRLMISRRKIELNYYNNPIMLLRSEIKDYQRKIFEAEKDYWRQCVGINSQHREINSLRDLNEGNKNKQKEDFDRELEIYKDTQRFRHMFKLEQDKDIENDEMRRTAINAKLQQTSHQKSQEEKNLNSELKNYENYNRKREEHFTRIKKVSNCVKPYDMLPYYIYLNETHKNLQEIVGTMQTELDVLHQEKAALDEKVHEIQYRMSGIDPQEFEDMKATFKEKNRDVDEKEAYLKQIDEVVATSINCVSRLMFQLYTDVEKEDVNKANRDGSAQGINPSNVEAILTVCGMKIGEMMKFITDHKS